MFVFLLIVMFALGAFMYFAPHLSVKRDQRDNPEAIEQTKKAGLLCMVGAVGAGLMMLKYTLR